VLTASPQRARGFAASDIEGASDVPVVLLSEIGNGRSSCRKSGNPGGRQRARWRYGKDLALIRHALLAASENRWLRDRAMKRPFVRRSVAHFMPGERVEDALQAAAHLRPTGIRALLTQLGENIVDPAQAEGVTQHYRDVLGMAAFQELECEISVKPTQLGLDVDPERSYANLRSLVQAAAPRGFVWIDMEQRAYVDRTLALYRGVLAEFQNVGVCLQAYLYRTAEDLESIRPLGGGVRLVKGAYLEPATVAFPQKRDVDSNYLTLARRLLAEAPEGHRCRVVFGTHDDKIITAIQHHARANGAGLDRFEFHLLYGIRTRLQKDLAQKGHQVRVLISYGSQWFPWYMRRLAERPANLMFVARSMFAR
jgi:proline dehydrogenase